MDWTKDLKDNAFYRLDENQRMIGIAIEKLRAHALEDFEDLFWKRPVQTGNSIGNLLLHLCGNMTQYVIASLGESPDYRKRDLEFDINSATASENVIEQFKQTLDRVKAVIREATPDQLLRKRHVQGFEMSGQGCIIHAIEHCSYHTGQIALWVKMITQQPLGFYDGLDLNQNNDES